MFLQTPSEMLAPTYIDAGWLVSLNGTCKIISIYMICGAQINRRNAWNIFFALVRLRKQSEQQVRFFPITTPLSYQFISVNARGGESWATFLKNETFNLLIIGNLWMKIGIKKLYYIFIPKSCTSVTNSGSKKLYLFTISSSL